MWLQAFQQVDKDQQLGYLRAGECIFVQDDTRAIAKTSQVFSQWYSFDTEYIAYLYGCVERIQHERSYIDVEVDF